MNFSSRYSTARTRTYRKYEWYSPGGGTPEPNPERQKRAFTRVLLRTRGFVPTFACLCLNSVVRGGLPGTETPG